MLLLLIRHGATDEMKRMLCGRLPGIHLNVEGQQQARTLGRKLKQICDVEALYSSPLERATETAAEVAAPQNIAVSTDDQLTEVDYGQWTGQTFDNMLGEDWKAYNRIRSLAATPGGESLLDVQTRAWRSVSAWMHQGRQTVAAVTHGDVIRALLLLLLGMHTDFISRIEIAPASLSTVSVWPGRAPVMHALNQTYPELLQI